MKWSVTKLVCSVILFLSLTPSSYAAFVLSGTRFIYNEGLSAVPVTVTNNAQQTFGGQAWVDSVNGADIPFSVVPNVFALEKGKKQRVQISILESETLPVDREAIFWLSVQEIPLKSKEDEGQGNVLKMAARTQVKLLYRPKVIIDEREHAEGKITLKKSGEKLILTNPTPYYFAVIKINQQDIKEPLLNTFAPYSEAQYPLPKNTNTISFTAINDWGGQDTYQCDLAKDTQQCKYIIKDR